MDTFGSSPQYIGRTSDGGRVYVTAQITHQRTEHLQTTDHQPAPEIIHRLSLVGEVYYPGDRGPTHRNPDPSQVGQTISTLAEITRPAAGWDLDQIRELVAYWRRWHLNDVQAGCAHTPAFTPNHRRGVEDNWNQRPTCPETGYRWGDAWLVEELPEAIANRIRSWFN